MALIKCSNCGRMISDKAKACPHCGNTIEQNVKPGTEGHSALPKAPKSEEFSKSRKGKSAVRVILAIFGSILLLYVGIIAFGYFRYGFISANPGHWYDVIRAEQGDADFQWGLADEYLNGSSYPLTDIPQDDYKAVKWFRKAAEQGHCLAQMELGLCYEVGRGVPQDYDEAVKWFRKAAEQGYEVAQNELGVCYYKGFGVPQDYAEAVNWYRKAAEQGYWDSMYNLGICYYEGFGVSQDYAEAVNWFRKAAEQGHVGSMYNLGVLYEAWQWGSP